MGLFSKKPQIDPVAMAEQQRMREEQEAVQLFKKALQHCVILLPLAHSNLRMASST